MDFGYGWEKLHLAIHSLCGGSSWSERIYEAYVYNLMHIDPDSNLPDDIREDFIEFMSEVDNFFNAIGGVRMFLIIDIDESFAMNFTHKVIDFYESICKVIDF